VGGKAEGCKQHRGDSAGGLRGKNEPKGFVGWSSAEGPNAAERNAEGDLRGGDEREEGDGGKQVGGERSEWRHGDGALKFEFQSAMHSLRFLLLFIFKVFDCRVMTSRRRLQIDSLSLARRGASPRIKLD
jgi:hypothetical protein